MSIIKNGIRLALGHIPTHEVERVLGYALLSQIFSELKNTHRYSSKEELWQSHLGPLSNDELTLLEFGVYEGYSINYFAELNSNPQSRFHGFDSFIGLPEDWIPTRKKGAFDVEGQPPQSADKRISYIKGWFQDTLPQFLATPPSTSSRLVVHYDADLYSSTLFCLMHIHSLRRAYLAIFDEFTGHESRALYNYVQMTGSRVEFLGQVGDRHFPTQVSCTITPPMVYAP